MKRFVLLALATLAGYVAVMSAIVAGIAGWSIRDQHELALLPVDHRLFLMVGVFVLMALLGVLGHVAILRRVD